MVGFDKSQFKSKFIVMRGFKEITVQLLARLGSIFTILCCLGFLPFLGLLTAIGAGFLIRDAFLIPLFILFLAVSLWGMKRGKDRHGNNKPLLLGIISSLSSLLFLRISMLFAYISVISLITAYIWDFYLVWTCTVRIHKTQEV